MNLRPFHVAVPVDDLQQARAFYGGLLGCAEGRSDKDWIDFNLFGHQVVCHRVEGHKDLPSPCNKVDGQQVPVPHYGVVLAWADWELLPQRLTEAQV